MAFLRVVDAHADVLYDADVLRLAVARYTLLWLPLCAQAAERASGTYLRPPLDIAFVWHCHVLNPTRCVARGAVCSAAFVHLMMCTKLVEGSTHANIQPTTCADRDCSSIRRLTGLARPWPSL